MPQLPSGRHVAIDPYPLATLLDAASNPANIHKIMGIDSIPKITNWFEVVYFVTPEEVHGKGIAAEFGEGSLTPPPGLVSLRTGCPLSQWETLAADWSDEDRSAMKTFLSEPRCKDYMEHRLSVVRQQQQDFLSAESFTTRLIAGWWMAGLHPAQEEGWDEAWDQEESPKWDTYDMLAALGNIVTYVAAHPDTYQEHGNAFDRATGMWQTLAGQHPFLHQKFDPELSVRDVASTWREAGHLDRIPSDRQEWLHKQMVIECVNLWNIVGQTLEHRCPRAYAIMTLVTISPEGEKWA
ncbi:MAG: hypothetical protein ACYC05_14990 [Sulfuricella sp.]